MATNNKTQPTNENGLTFQQYRNQVNAILATTIGLSIDDLTDFDLHEYWEAGETPHQAARDALENDDGGIFFDNDSLDDMFDDDGDGDGELYTTEEELPNADHLLALGMGGYESDIEIND